MKSLDISQAEEYRELVKTYAGQIFSAMLQHPYWQNEKFDRIREVANIQTHALAKEVLTSLSTLTEKAE